jgi:hypothetical protein
METEQPEAAVTDHEATVEPAAETTKPKTLRRRGARSPGATAPSGGASEERGSVGRQIYAEVNRIIDAEAISKQEAFARVGAAQGRQTGTVAANYYRVARAGGGGRGSARARQGSGRRRRSRMRGDSQSAIAALRGALDELGRALRDQDREIARLREENAQFGELRALIGRTRASTGRGSRARR